MSLFENIYKVKEPIALSDIFNVKNDSGKLSKRLLVIGRAGIGKTTFCKHIVYRWRKETLWKDRFDYVFFLPLRILTEQYSTNPALTAVSAIRKTCCKKFSSVSEQQIETALIRKRCLLLLDGFDEAAAMYEEDPKCKAFLNALLKYDNVIITSRPYNISRLNADNTLEIMGFTDQNIPKYVRKFFKLIPQPERGEALLQWLEKNFNIWSIAHIPINLELICSLWDKKILDTEQGMTLTDLYTAILEQLLRRYLEKRTNMPVNQYQLDGMNASKILGQCQPVLHFLEELAFRGLTCQNNIILSSKLINAVLQHTEETFKGLAENILHDLNEAGFINPYGEGGQLTHQDYYFIHFTVQEYFAARYIVRQLQCHRAIEAHQQIQQFIAKNIQEERYTVVWWFVGGLLSNDANLAQSFFKTLMSSAWSSYPNKMLLSLKCLDESQLINIPLKEDILRKSHFFMWNTFMQLKPPFYTAPSNYTSIINMLRSSIFLLTLKNHNIVKDIETLLAGQATEKKLCASLILVALGQHNDRVLKKLLELLKRRGGHVTEVVMILGEIGKDNNPVVEAVIGLLEDKEWEDLRFTVAWAVGKVGEGNEQVIKTLIGCLKDEEEDVRFEATKALRKVRAGNERVLEALQVFRSNYYANNIQRFFQSVSKTDKGEPINNPSAWSCNIL